MTETANRVMATLSGRRTVGVQAACGHRVYGQANDDHTAERPRIAEVKQQARSLPCERCALEPVQTPVRPAGQPTATPQQLKYARSLIRKHLGEYTAHGQIASETLLVEITKQDCKRLIDHLLTLDNQGL